MTHHSTPRVGSSPLARGLLVPFQLALDDPGIIPARAGFTVRVHGHRVRLGDHPRSRGVYLLGPQAMSLSRGSSPLARGLHGASEPAQWVGGIIPARAGFTNLTPHPLNVRTDHPRSRGVYSAPCPMAGRKSGSSPLARGLPATLCSECSAYRIIPARAGFTPGGPFEPIRPGDHPRSRGVYFLTPCSWRPRSGSSPLARGLRSRIPRSGGGAGIIPARAGFTPRAPRSTCRPWDHPRSRGVYIAVRYCPGARMGSSPLARGLHPGKIENYICEGIIPARAGFTTFPYADADRSPGSSPLARGLRVMRRMWSGPSGIIPARAGFTPGQPSQPLTPRDHPRSRGVYCEPPPGDALHAGSSPLARGLRRDHPRP